MKDSVIFYKSFYEIIKELPEKSQIELYNAIFQKYFYGIENDLKGISKGIFGLIVPNIDSANKRYFANLENGKKGGRPKKENKTEQKPTDNPIKTQSKPNNNLNDNVNENDNDNVNDNIKEIKKEKIFVKPTIEEIQEYIEERNNGINANAFYDFYESKNWYVGKNKMKDWKACIRTWEQRNGNKQKLPEWFNDDNKDDKISKEEKIELESLLKKFER